MGAFDDLIPSGNGATATAPTPPGPFDDLIPQQNPFADLIPAAPQTASTAVVPAAPSDAPSISGTGKTFGTNMDGSVDMTDVGRMSDFDAHHGAYKGVDLRNPDLAGVAIGGDQAVSLTGIKDPAKAQQAMMGQQITLSNPDTGQSAAALVVDKGPLDQAQVEATPAAHRLVGSNGRSNLTITAPGGPNQFADLIPSTSSGSGAAPSASATDAGGGIPSPTIAPDSAYGRLLTWFGGGEEATNAAQKELEQGQAPVTAERPPAAMKIAGAIDWMANKLTGGAAGPSTLEDMVQSSTRVPQPGETSFTNLGIPSIPPQQGAVAQVGAGLANFPIAAANFLLSPAGVTTAASVGMLPKVAQTLVGAGFTAGQVKDFIQAPTLQDRVTTAVGATLLGLGTVADARGALPGRPNVPPGPQVGLVDAGNAFADLVPQQGAVPAPNAAAPPGVPESGTAPGPERIVSVAIRNKGTGAIVTGANHAEAFLKAHPDATDHDEWSGIKNEITRQYEKGFVTSSGRFLPPKEANDVALASRQIADRGVGELAHDDIAQQQPPPAPEAIPSGYQITGKKSTGFSVKIPSGDALTFPPNESLANVQAFTQQHAAAFREAPKLKLAANRNEAGFLNPDLLQGAADLGRKILGSTMDFAHWSGEMIRQLGDKIRPHLTAIWNSITGQNLLPHAQERGGAYLGPSQADIEGSANDRQKMREHVATVGRMTDVSPSVKDRVASWMTPSSIPEVEARAQARVNELGIDKAMNAVLTASKTDSADFGALAHTVALRLDSLGRYDDAAAVRNKMAESLTGPAQLMQYVSTIAKTSPEGLIREAQKLVTEQLSQNPDKMQTAADVKTIMAQLQAALEGKDPKTRQALVDLLLSNLAKVNKPGQRLTPTQLSDLIKQNNAGELTPDKLAAALKRYFGIPQLSPDNIAAIKAAQKLYAATTDPLMKLRRGAEMMDSVYGLVPRSIWDKVRTTAVISMIFHGKLPIRIGLSNALHLAGQTTVDAIENVPRDIGNVFTGRKTVTAAQLGAIADGLKEPYSTFKSGYDDAKIRGLTRWPAFKEGVQTLIDLANMTTRGVYDLDNMKGRSRYVFSSRFGRMAEDATTLIHNTVPYAFWNAGFKSSLARQMAIAGVDSPTEDMVGNARLDANKATFQNETVGYKILQGLRKTLDAPTARITDGRYGLGTATLPFAKVPAALLTEGATWSPLGFIRAGWEGIGRPLVNKIKTGDADFQGKQVADSVIKAALGTGSLFATGYWLARLGVITGAPDEDKNLDAMMKSLGWGAYKINLSELHRRFQSGDFTSRTALPQAGDNIINYNWAEPAALAVAMGANVAHSADARARMQERGLITPAQWLSAAGAGVQSITDNPMLQGVQRLGSDVGEGNYTRLFADTVGNIPANFVPSLVRQTAQYMDNTVRETRAGGPVTAEMSRIEAQIPGLSTKFPPRYDVFGEAVKRQNYGRVSLINTFFNPAQVSKFNANPEVAEMMRLTTATGSSGAVPKNVPASLTITKLNGQKQQIQLDNQQLATYQRYVGQLAAAMTTRLLASPAYASAPDIVRQNTLTEVLGAVERSAKIDLFHDRPFRVNAGTLLSKPSVSMPTPLDIASFFGGRARQLNKPVATGTNQ